MNAWKKSGANNREDGHGFGESIDASAPLLSKQEQDGADQSSGVTDADPEHEVGDVERPHDGIVQTPHANTSEDEIVHAETQQADKTQTDCERGVPRERWLLGFGYLADLTRDLAKAIHVQHKWRAYAWILSGVVRFLKTRKRGLAIYGKRTHECAP